MQDFSCYNKIVELSNMLVNLYRIFLCVSNIKSRVYSNQYAKIGIQKIAWFVEHKQENSVYVHHFSIENFWIFSKVFSNLYEEINHTKKLQKYRILMKMDNGNKN